MQKNIPMGSSQNIPLAQLGQYGGGSYRKSRRYTRAQEIERLAVDKYNKNGKGITYNDLLSSGLASHKQQAQITLKHCLRMKLIFTLGNYKPQQYYPICLKSEISKNELLKNIPVGVTGVGCFFSSKTSPFSDTKINSSCTDSVIIQSLEGYILPLLPSAPLFIHKMQFKLRIIPECYMELKLPTGKGNNVKEHAEVVGKVRVTYHLYANGTVMVFTESSNNPFKLEDEADRSRLMAFFGQVRDRLVTFLMDTHERIIPDILEWELTQCDINKDIMVSEALHYTGIKVQVKHFDHLFRVYIKSIGKETACRIEESLSPKKPAVQALIEILGNPNEQGQQSSYSSFNGDDSTRKIAEIHDMVRSLLDLIHNHDSSIIGQQEIGREGGGS